MEDIDIWRTAKLLIDQHGLLAWFRAMVRASELKAAGDDAGAEVWGRVFHAIGELYRTERTDKETLQ